VQTYAAALDDVFPYLGSYIRTHPLRAAAVSDREMIFDAGSGSTGTKSLGVALNQLNFTGCHLVGTWLFKLQKLIGWNKPGNRLYVPDALDCIEKARTMNYSEDLEPHIQYILDTPVPELFIDLFFAFPNAKWFLSTRPTDLWSSKRHIVSDVTAAPIQEPCGLLLGDFSDEMNSKFLELNQDFVRCVVPSERLFEFSVFTDPPEKMQTLMRRIAAFLGRDLSHDMKFPHLGDYDNPFVAADVCFTNATITR